MPEFIARVRETRIVDVTVEAESEEAVWAGDYEELDCIEDEGTCEQSTESVVPA